MSRVAQCLWMMAFTRFAGLVVRIKRPAQRLRCRWGLFWAVEGKDR
ncbi:MAG: hypothetical protein PHR16_16815 [Methylovulum sp.]|nr:hypothetical protein [Methylovulum sp.]